MPANLAGVVHNILIDYSGGIKFTELMVKVLEYHIDKDRIVELSSVSETNMVDRLLEVLEQDNKFGILRYTFQPLNREKMFIYTK